MEIGETDLQAKWFCLDIKNTFLKSKDNVVEKDIWEKSRDYINDIFYQLLKK